MIGLLLALFAALLLGLHGPAPAPHSHGSTAAPAPAVVAPARSVAPAPAASSAPGAPHPSAPATVAAPPAADEQRQLPSEVIGRQLDGPDGSVCTVTDTAGGVACGPAPSPAP